MLASQLPGRVGQPSGVVDRTAIVEQARGLEILEKRGRVGPAGTVHRHPEAEAARVFPIGLDQAAREDAQRHQLVVG
jgi:hypothetical protein